MLKKLIFIIIFLVLIASQSYAESWILWEHWMAVSTVAVASSEDWGVRAAYPDEGTCNSIAMRKGDERVNTYNDMARNNPNQLAREGVIEWQGGGSKFFLTYKTGKHFYEYLCLPASIDPRQRR